MFPAIDHRAADLADDSRCAVALPRFKKRFDNLLSGAKILAVGSQNTERESRGLVPVQVFDIEIEEKLGLLAALFELGHTLEELRCVAELALRGGGPGFHNGGGQAIWVDLQSLVDELFGFGVVSAGEGALRGRNVSFNGIARLSHGLIEIGQANLDAEIVGLREEKFFQEADGFGLAIVLEVDFRELQKERTGLAHHSLLDIKVSQLFKGANFFRG